MKDPTYIDFKRTAREQLDVPGALHWHEAAHALVGYRLGMEVQFIDMTGLLIPSPVCGLDSETVPADQRARATAITALAGPIGEAMIEDRGFGPMWRQDGEVAKSSAKALAPDVVGQMELLIEWRRTAKRMLMDDPAYEPLVHYLHRNGTLTGREVHAFIEASDRKTGHTPPARPQAPRTGLAAHAKHVASEAAQLVLQAKRALTK